MWRISTFKQMFTPVYITRVTRTLPLLVPETVSSKRLYGLSGTQPGAQAWRGCYRCRKTGGESRYRRGPACPDPAPSRHPPTGRGCAQDYLPGGQCSGLHNVYREKSLPYKEMHRVSWHPLPTELFPVGTGGRRVLTDHVECESDFVIRSTWESHGITLRAFAWPQGSTECALPGFPQTALSSARSSHTCHHRVQSIESGYRNQVLGKGDQCRMEPG